MSPPRKTRSARFSPQGAKNHLGRPFALLESSQRQPQLALRLDATLPDPAEHWHEGTTMVFLGGHIRLTLDTTSKDALLDGNALHLPLPPQATPRQIRDRAEAWLRAAAKRKLAEVIAQKSALAGRRPPQLMLSFAAQGHWAEVRSADTLRCNWHLIEQPLTIIEQVIARAIATMPPLGTTANEADLFAPAAAFTAGDYATRDYAAP